MVAKSKKAASAVPAVPAKAAAPAPANFPRMSLEALADLGRENLTAMAKANLAWSQGLGAMSDEVLAFAKSNVLTASKAASALLGAKTLTEVMEVNSGLAKSTMESLMARSAKLGELGITTTNQALAPLNARLEAAIAGLKRPAVV